MSKADDYRARAAECRRMADQARNADEKRTWLNMAESWLRMIRQRAFTAAEKFDANERQIGTHQPPSEASH